MKLRVNEKKAKITLNKAEILELIVSLDAAQNAFPSDNIKKFSSDLSFKLTLAHNFITGNIEE